MAWNEVTSLRTLAAKTWQDSLDPARHVRHHVLGAVLHYPTVLDSEVLDGEVDFTFEHVTAGGRDLYRTVVAGWHYALGRDVTGIFAGVDGTVGFGGRQGAHWLKFRLARVGYLHWPTRNWEGIGGGSTYNRAYLNYEVDALSIGPEDAQTTLNVGGLATWDNIWNTPDDGAIDVSWRVDERQLKEEIEVNQAAREWIAANLPPLTPADETWLSFIFQLDISDIPRWVIAGILQDPDGDFTDDDGDIEIRDALDRLLAFMPASIAFSEPDENGKRDIVRLRKRIWRDGDGNHYLLVGARVDQLNAMRAGAIVFDPTFETQPGSEGLDTTLLAGNSNKSAGSDISLPWSTPTGAKCILEFDCSSISGDATCDSATLHLWQAGATPSGARTFTIHELLVANEDWVEGASEDPATAGQSTWDHKNDWNGGGGGDVNWAGSAGASTSGTDYDASALGSDNGGGSDGAEIAITLTTAAVQDWFGTPNENYGIIGWTNAWINTDSSDGATAAERPKLVVEYTGAAAGALPMAMNHYRRRRV